MDLNRLRYIGDRPVGPDHPVYVTAEIGINHNGSLDDALALIDVAADAGCDAVKFQKRTPEICVPKDQQDVERETPWGRMTYLDYRYRVEFDQEQYAADQPALRPARHRLVRLTVGSAQRRLPRVVQPARPQDRIGLSH